MRTLRYFSTLVLGTNYILSIIENILGIINYHYHYLCINYLTTKYFNQWYGELH